MRNAICWWVGAWLVFSAFFGLASGPENGAREPIQTEKQRDVSPILVTAMVHLDPLPLVNDANVVLDAYVRHRDAWLWYLNLADATGVALSAQMTGVYAEACVRQGHASDFADCMPGGPHHLGTHLHGNVKGEAPYEWRRIPEGAYHDPEITEQVFCDNIPWVNRVFEENGFTYRDNWFLHGSQVTFFGMDEDLFGRPDLPFHNTYDMAGALRGRLYVYRGDFLAEPDEESGSCIKMAEVGGIIGEDRVHGPEGMVYGSVPYQRRDFLRAYLEWRESVRRGEMGPVRHFTWMVHPYQLVDDYVGSGGRSARACIEELVAWLNAEFIGQPDESGFVIARYAHAAEIRQEFEAWESAHPNEAADLQQAMRSGNPPLHLPAIHQRLESTYHCSSVEPGNENVRAHQFKDHDTGADVYVAWTTDGNTHSLSSWMSGTARVLGQDGSFEIQSIDQMTVGPEPVLFEIQPRSPAFAEFVIIPHIATNPDWKTELFVDNLDTIGTELEITLYRDGDLHSVRQVRVGAGEAARFALEGGDCGKVGFRGGRASFKTCFEHLMEGGMAEFQLAAAGSTDLVYLLPYGMNITWQGLALANMTDTSTRATLTAMGVDGESVATRDLDIAAHTRWVGTLDDLFPDIDPFTLIRVHGSASIPLAGMVISGNQNRSLLFTQATAIQNPFSMLSIPHLADPHQGWSNTLVVDHLGSDDASLAIAFHGGDGRTETRTWSIPAHRQTVIDLDRAIDFKATTASIDLSSPNLLVRQRFLRVGQTGMAEFLLHGKTGSEIAFEVTRPLGDGVTWQGVALCNPSAVSGQVTLHAWVQRQIVDEVHLILEAHASYVATLDEVFDAPHAGAIEKVTARADVPLTGLFMAGADHDSYLFSSATPMNPVLPDDSPFGFHPARVTLPEYPDNGYVDAANIGVSWTREGVYAFWFLIQQDRDVQEYDFTLYDRQWGEVPDDMRILGNLSPQGSRDEGRCLPGSWIPVDPEQYARFVEATVERYDGDGIDDMPDLRVPITTWQVGNEPDQRGRRGFAELQQITYDAVKQACPDCRVMIGGVAGFPDGYIANFESGYRPILHELKGQAVDIFDFHWYGHAFGDYRLRDGDTQQDVLETLRQALTDEGFPPDLPIWITEMGSYCGAPAMVMGHDVPPQSEREHARDLFKRFVYPLSRGIEKVFPAFGLAEGFMHDDGYFDHTGLIYDGQQSGDLGLGIKKLAYHTHKKMTQILAGADWNTCQEIQPELLEHNICVFRVFRAGEPIFIAWLDAIDADQEETVQMVTLDLEGLEAQNVSVIKMVPDQDLGRDVTDFESAFSEERCELIDGTDTIELGFDPIVIEPAVPRDD